MRTKFEDLICSNQTAQAINHAGPARDPDAASRRSLLEAFKLTCDLAQGQRRVPGRPRTRRA